MHMLVNHYGGTENDIQCEEMIFHLPSSPEALGALGNELALLLITVMPFQTLKKDRLHLEGTARLP